MCKCDCNCLCITRNIIKPLQRTIIALVYLNTRVFYDGSCKCRGEIIVGNDGDKGKDVKSGDGVEGKDRDDVGKSSSREGEIIDKDDEEKCEGRATDTESCDKVGGGDRDDLNTELSGDDICEEILGRSGASDGDVES